jgi:hypothetical protein
MRFEREADRFARVFSRVDTDYPALAQHPPDLTASV